MLSQEFSSFYFQDMKTPRCKYPCVSLGTTGSSLLSGIRCASRLLNPVPSINITCYETKLSPGNTACQCGGGGVQRHQPGCRSKPSSARGVHMQRAEHRGTRTNAGIHWQKQRRRHRATPAWLRREALQSPLRSQDGRRHS